MTHNKYSTQVNNKYNDVFINKFEKPSNIIQKRLQKATTVTNDDESQLRANKTGYANLVNEYKKLGITTMPDFNTYDVNDPNYMDKYDPQKALEMQNQALAGQKRDKIWNSLTPAQQYAYTTLASSAKSLGMDVPAIESVDLSNPFWLAKTLNDVNEKISYTNFKSSFDANKAYAFDQFKQEKMIYDDRTRFNDAATWQKMWDESAQSKLWSDDSFNSQWNTQLTIDRMQNGVWDLGQWGNNGRGGSGGRGGGGGPEGGGPEGGGPDNPNIKNPTPDQMVDTYINEYVNGRNRDGPNGEPVVYQQGTIEYEDAIKAAKRIAWKELGPIFQGSWGRKIPNYITAQGNRPSYTENDGTIYYDDNGKMKTQKYILTAEQQAYINDYAKELKNQYGENSDEYKTFLLTPPLKQLKAVVDEGYKGGVVSLGAPYVPSKDAFGNTYGSPEYITQSKNNWLNAQNEKIKNQMAQDANTAMGLNTYGIPDFNNSSALVPSFNTITEAVAAGISPYDAAAMFGVYPGGLPGIISNDLNQSKTPYDKIGINVSPTTINPNSTVGVAATKTPFTGVVRTPTAGTSSRTSPTTTPITGVVRTPTAGTSSSTSPTTTPVKSGVVRTPTAEKRLEEDTTDKRKFRMSNTKKFMGGKSGRMGPLIDDGVGEKGRYFEKGNTRKSQSRNAIKFYETDKTDNVPMSKSFMKALARKIHEINDANYYGNEKPKRSDSIRKDGNFGASVNLGGTINNYVSPNQRIPSKQMYELDTPRQKTPTPMGASAMKKPMGGSLNAFNPYPRSGSMATGMGAPTMKRMTTHKTITRLSQKSLPQGIPRPPQKVSSKYR